jgi:hypothetical protein
MVKTQQEEVQTTFLELHALHYFLTPEDCNSICWPVVVEQMGNKKYIESADENLEKAK